jgi:hypothetical protein
MNQDIMHEYRLNRYWTLITEYLPLDAAKTAWGWWWTLAGGTDPTTGEYAEYLGRWCLDLHPETAAWDPHILDQPYATEQAAMNRAQAALAAYPGARRGQSQA